MPSGSITDNSSKAPMYIIFLTQMGRGLFHHVEFNRLHGKDLPISLRVPLWHQGGRRSCCRRVSCLCWAAGQQQQGGCTLPGAATQEEKNWVKFYVGIPQREWRMVAQALSVPRYDFAMAHIPTSRWRHSHFQQQLILLSGWTQAQYARSPRVYPRDRLHCTNSADCPTLFLLWEIFLFIQN